MVLKTSKITWSIIIFMFNYKSDVRDINKNSYSTMKRDLNLINQFSVSLGNLITSTKCQGCVLLDNCFVLIDFVLPA